MAAGTNYISSRASIHMGMAVSCFAGKTQLKLAIEWPKCPHAQSVPALSNLADTDKHKNNILENFVLFQICTSCALIYGSPHACTARHARSIYLKREKRHDH